MRYTMLLWPHANARYQQETEKLARAELRILLDAYAPEAALLEGAGVAMSGELPAVGFEASSALSEEAVAAISRHSLLYALFETREEGVLVPVTGRFAPALGGDLPGILKYKGKTNELFCHLLIQTAWYAAGRPEKPLVYDPMCGRATTLFTAVNLGMDAVGSDIDRNDLREAETFFKRYLTYHRFKHTMKKSSRTLEKKKNAPLTEFTVSPAEKPPVSLSLCELDATLAREAFGKNRFHMVVADLPYGVQHSAGMPIEKLLPRALSAWKEVLKSGGAVALSFNRQTLPTAKLRQMMEDAGLEPLSGGAYDRFDHWVEQAVTRDIAVAVKK